MHFFDTHTKGDLVTRLTGDLDMIRHSIAWIIMMVVESCALFLFTVIYFFTLDWLMTLCILALTTKRQKPSGRNWPNRMPTMIAMMSLGSSPSLNFFFSSIFLFLPGNLPQLFRAQKEPLLSGKML